MVMMVNYFWWALFLTEIAFGTFHYHKLRYHKPTHRELGLNLRRT